MGVLDFLFEGQAPPSVATYGQTVQSLPTWLSDYTQGLIGRANAIAAEPYQAYGGPRVAGFSPDQKSAFDLTRGGVGSAQPILQQGIGALQRGTQMTPWAAASPYFPAAAGMIQGGASGSALGAAMPFLSGAGQTYPQAVGSYMSPYVGNVINRASDLAMRTFNERMMPELNDQFINAGQFGSTRHQELANRGARDITEGLQSQALSALDSAYTTGGNLFNQDMSRLGTIGSTLGGLAGQDYSRLLQGGTSMGALGQTVGGLADATGRLSIDASGRFADLASQLQRMNLADAGALQSIGGQQQGLAQTNLDRAYQDFQNQTAYPRQTVDWLSSVIRGLQAPQATSTTQVGPLQGSQYGASPAQQIGGLADILRGLQPIQGTGGG